MARRSAITLAVCAGLALAARRADAQSTTGACAPVIEVGGNVPPRMAQRLRRLLALAQRDVTSAPCERSRVRLEWTSRELTAHIELHDGSKTCSRRCSRCWRFLRPMVTRRRAPTTRPPRSRPRLRRRP